MFGFTFNLFSPAPFKTIKLATKFIPWSHKTSPISPKSIFKGRFTPGRHHFLEKAYSPSIICSRIPGSIVRKRVKLPSIKLYWRMDKDVLEVIVLDWYFPSHVWFELNWLCAVLRRMQGSTDPKSRVSKLRRWSPFDLIIIAIIVLSEGQNNLILASLFPHCHSTNLIYFHMKCFQNYVRLFNLSNAIFPPSRSDNSSCCVWIWMIERQQISWPDVDIYGS